MPRYRAFNKKTKKMYSVEGFKLIERKIYRCSLAYDEFRSGRLETFHFVEDNLDDYILMQSTGLYDKNGEEFFDWDVVMTTRFAGRADVDGGYYEYEKDYTGVVKMLKGTWSIEIHIKDRDKFSSPYYRIWQKKRKYIYCRLR